MYKHIVGAALIGTLVSAHARAATLHQECVASRAALPSGIDVSDLNGTIDWNIVKSAGYSFAFIKSSQGAWGGSNSNDAQFSANWKNARAAGLLRSAYHFFDPTSDVQAQIDLFVSLVGDFWEPGELPPMIDLECPTSSDPSYRSKFCDGVALNGWVASSVLTSSIVQFLDGVEAKTGRRPIIYSYDYWFWDSGVDRTKLESWPLDISWPTSADCYDVPDVFGPALFWQDSVTANVAGVPKVVDTDRFVGTLDQLRALASGGAQQLGGNGTISVIGWPDGHEEAFARNVGGNILQVSRVGTSWHPSSAIGFDAQCGERAIFGAAAPSVVGVDVTGSALATSWDATNLVWKAPLTMPGITARSVVPSRVGSGKLGVLATGVDDSLSWSVFDGATAPTWTGLEISNVASAVVIGDSRGDSHAFALDRAGGVSAASTTLGAWSAFQSLGGLHLGELATAILVDGTIVLAATNDKAQIEIATSTAGGFSAWSALDGNAMPSPSIAPTASGAVVVGRSTDARVLFAKAVPGAKLTEIPGVTAASAPFAFARADGALDVFVVDGQNALRVATSLDGVTFGAWSTIAADVDGCNEQSFPPPTGDGGASPEDAGSHRPPPTGSSGCSSSSESTTTWGWLALVGVVLVAKRRTR